MRVLLVAPAPPPYGGMALQGQQLCRRLQSDGVEVISFASNFDLPQAIRLLQRVPGLRTLVRAALIWGKLWVGARQADVVHVLAASWLFFFVVVYPSVIIGRIQGKRLVVNYRGGQAREFFRRYSWMVAPVFKLADVVTAPSEFLASLIRQRFGVDVSIVPNILDTAAFNYRRRTSIRPTLLVTRHLEKEYDIESVLKAFRVVQGSIPEASLCIAGTGSEEPHLRCLVESWKLENVRFLGEVAHRDLPAVHDACDIYVNASLVDNFPGALLEASASGLVIVTTAAGGIPHIYQHEHTALLVEPGDWQAIAAAVRRVLEEPAKALRMTEEAVVVASSCTWTKVRDRLYAAYGRSEPGTGVAQPELGRTRCEAR